MEEEIITVGKMKEFIKDLPDDYKFWVPIWGFKTAPVDDVDIDHAKKKVNIIADVA